MVESISSSHYSRNMIGLGFERVRVDGGYGNKR